MAKAIVIPFHQYTVFGHQFYQPLLDYCLAWAKEYRDEYNTLYLKDSDWGIPEGDYKILKPQNPGHHWIQFRDAIPQIKEDNILFLDNDVIFYRKGIIDSWFKKLEEGYDCAISFDGSGGLKGQVQNKFPILKENNATRMLSYHFLLSKKLLPQDLDFAPINYTEGTYIKELDYTTVKGDWSDSFGLFTIKLLAQNPKIFTIQDDRSSIYFDGSKRPDKGLDLGYYHIRAGSTIPYLLASKNSDNPDHHKTYRDYLNFQPKQEYLRQLAFYEGTCIDLGNEDRIKDIILMLKDLEINQISWMYYLDKVKKYHGL